MAANVNAKGISIEKGNLVVKMPLSKGTPSSSGKSMVLATTHGAVEVDGVMVNITAYRKN